MCRRGVVNAMEVNELGASMSSRLAMSRARAALMASGPLQCIPDYSLVDGRLVPLVRSTKVIALRHMSLRLLTHPWFRPCTTIVVHYLYCQSGKSPLLYHVRRH